MILALFIWHNGELLRPTDKRYEDFPEAIRELVDKLWALRVNTDKIPARDIHGPDHVAKLTHKLIALAGSRSYSVGKFNKFEWYDEKSWDHNAERWFPDEKWERKRREAREQAEQKLSGNFVKIALCSIHDSTT